MAGRLMRGKAQRTSVAEQERRKKLRAAFLKRLKETSSTPRVRTERMN